MFGQKIEQFARVGYSRPPNYTYLLHLHFNKGPISLPPDGDALIESVISYHYNITVIAAVPVVKYLIIAEYVARLYHT